MTIKTKEIRVGLAQLMLDPNNYRLNKGEETNEYTGKQIIEMQAETQRKLISENISDLETSIIKNGFLEVDKIVVKELTDISDSDEFKKYVVIEGNRRTAAFKSLINEYYLIDEERFDDDFPDSLQDKYQKINVILVEGNDSEIESYSQRLMGIRHVSGPRPWGGYQSAKLINDMAEAEQGYKKIGTLLGMRPSEAQRRHEAYLAIQQMKRDLKYKDKATPKLFTLFSEIVGSNKFFKEEWLGWNHITKQFDHANNLYRIYDGITPNDNGNQEINNPSRLRFFAKCVNTEEIRLQLEDGVLLDDIDYDFDSEIRIKTIEKFITFTNKLTIVSKEENRLFLELQKSIKILLKPEQL